MTKARAVFRLRHRVRPVAPCEDACPIAEHDHPARVLRDLEPVEGARAHQSFRASEFGLDAEVWPAFVAKLDRVSALAHLSRAMVSAPRTVRTPSTSPTERYRSHPPTGSSAVQSWTCLVRVGAAVEERRMVFTIWRITSLGQR